VGGAELAIEATGLEKRYGRFRALHGIDLAIPRGVIYGVLGPSGAGKTTLVKCLGLVARPTTGTLRLFGAAVRGRDRGVRERIGYMPQQAALYEELAARTNIEFFARGAAAGRIDDLLAMVNLSDRAGDAVGGFSGGMKQRVSLACALARQPDLLLLDEPTAGIDPLLRISFWEEFRRLRDQGVTLLVSTHQIDEAYHCDRLLIIRNGTVFLDGTPAEILGLGGASARARRKDGEAVERRMTDPDRELPVWIAELGVDSLAELNIRHDSLEEILVRLIRERGEAVR